MRILKLRATFVAATLWLLFSGCASIRETVQWDFKAEKTLLEPHEQRREELEYLV